MPTFFNKQQFDALFRIAIGCGLPWVDLISEGMAHNLLVPTQELIKEYQIATAAAYLDAQDPIYKRFVEMAVTINPDNGSYEFTTYPPTSSHPTTCVKVVTKVTCLSVITFKNLADDKTYLRLEIGKGKAFQQAQNTQTSPTEQLWGFPGMNIIAFHTPYITDDDVNLIMRIMERPRVDNEKLLEPLRRIAQHNKSS